MLYISIYIYIYIYIEREREREREREIKKKSGNQLWFSEFYFYFLELLRNLRNSYYGF
jgi:hypothetical protein